MWVFLAKVPESARSNHLNGPGRVETEGRREIPRKPASKQRAIRIQYGALPYRLDGNAFIEVLLVTSRRTRRWIIPKGWPIKGMTPARAAAREAYEEAGVRGRVAGRAIGRYVYEKRLEDRGVSIHCEVRVFLLAVTGQSKNWPESKERTARWFSAANAIAVIADDGLRDLILRLEALKGTAPSK